MKRWIALVMVLLGASFSVGVAAADQEHGGREHAGHADGQGEAPADGVTGEVVDLACYLGHGARGAGHRDCAEKCIASGLPVGILSEEGRVYVAIGGEHEPANSTLAPLAAKRVRATGEVTEQSGVHLIALERVEVVE